LVEHINQSPLNSYFTAGVTALVGWRPQDLRLFYLIPALALAVGTWRLAGRCCRRPMLAALTAVVTPAFLLCRNLMVADVTAAAFWVWSTILWIDGLVRCRRGLLLAAAALAALCALAKYTGYRPGPAAGRLHCSCPTAGGARASDSPVFRWRHYVCARRYFIWPMVGLPL